jgi:cystathionine beta-lyase/cystathionine gamma-synthase
MESQLVHTPGDSDPRFGDVESLICHPATMTHASIPAELRQQMGIGDRLLRLSVGIEHVDDLIADIDQALG